MIDKSKVIDFLKAKYGFEVFGQDVRKDEVRKNKSFFIINDDGEIRKGNNQFLIDFYISFFTRENVNIDPVDLITSIEDKFMGLIFDNTDIDFGKIQGTDLETKMTTFVFHRIVRRCY